MEFGGFRAGLPKAHRVDVDISGVKGGATEYGHRNISRHFTDNAIEMPFSSDRHNPVKTLTNSSVEHAAAIHRVNGSCITVNKVDGVP